MIRRGILAILLVTLVAAGAGWQDAAPTSRTVDGAVSVPRPLGVASDAVVRARPDIVAGGFAEQRSAKGRPLPDFLPLLSLAVLVALTITGADRPGPSRPSILGRRHLVSLRAPPLLRFS